MTTKGLSRVRELFEAAADLDGAAREEFLARQCGPDTALREQLARMLESRRAGESFLASPAISLSLADAAHAVDPLIGRTFGQYRVRDILGRGGMGVVYLAEQDRPRRTVALKLIRSVAVSPTLLRRFEHETEVLGRLKHPGIAQVYDAGTARGPDGTVQPFFAMELIRGRTLLDHVRATAPSTRERLELFIRICEAVQHAHQRGVIHRDLKPGNILIEDEPGGKGDASRGGTRHAPAQPKILDFGVARIVDPEAGVTMQTDAGQVIGTLQYMSPEQARGQSELVDTRSDVYSLGVILFEMLTGRLPYDVARQPVTEAARIINEHDPSTLGGTDRSLRGELEVIVSKALSKEPERRYQSASDMAEDVRRYLSDLPIVARPASTVYQLRKFARRHRTLVAGVGGVFVALLVGLVATTVFMFRAREAEGQAQRSAMAAQAQARRSMRTLRYFTDLLSGARPDVARGKELTVRELLDQSAADIGSSLDSEPLVKAAVLDAVGRAYLALGDVERAEGFLRTAFNLREANLPADHEDMAESWRSIASVAQERNDFKSALEHCARAMAIAEKARPGSDLVAGILNDMGSAHMRLGEYAKAEPLLTRSLAIIAALPADQRDGEITTLGNHAIALDKLGRDTEAEEEFRRAITLSDARRGPDHPDVATNLRNLAMLLEVQGRYDEAERLHRRGIDIRRRVLGPDHPHTLMALDSLASMFTQTGRYEEAEGILREVIANRGARFGPDDDELAASLLTLGNIQLKRERGAEAEATFREALRIREKARPGHWSSAMILGQIAAAVKLQGQPEQAEALLRRAIGLHEQAGLQSVSYAAHLGALGDVLGDQGRAEEAEACYRKALDFANRRFRNNFNWGATASRLARFCATHGKDAEAESLYRDVIELYRAQPATPVAKRRRVLSDFAAFLEARGRADAAVALRQELAELGSEQDLDN